MSNFPNQGTAYLEGNPVKRVSLLTDNATPQNSPKVINGEVREQIMLCDPLTGAALDLQAGGGGGGSGTVKSVNTQQPDGSGNVTLTALSLNVLGVPGTYDPTTNTPTLVSGQVPPGGATDFRVINSPFPGTAVSISPYITTVSNDDLLYWDGQYLRQITAAQLPRRVANYTPSTPYTATPAESGALISLNLGALAQGSRVMLKLEEYGNNSSSGQTMKVYLNGVQIFTTTSITFVAASPSWCWDLDFVVASLTRVHGSGRGVGSAAPTSSLADRVVGAPTISSTVNTITVTMTNAATGASSGVQYLDATVFN